MPAGWESYCVPTSAVTVSSVLLRHCTEELFRLGEGTQLLGSHSWAPLPSSPHSALGTVCCPGVWAGGHRQASVMPGVGVVPSFLPAFPLWNARSTHSWHLASLPPRNPSQ